MDHAFHPTHAVQSATAPQVRHVALGAPFRWLRLGAQDLLHSLWPSLGLGVAVAVAGWMLLAATWQSAYLAPALLYGFLYVAPFAAIPIYGYSRQLERRDAIDPAEAHRVWRANPQSIALFGLMLAVTLIFWERIAAIVFAAFYRGEPLHPTNLLTSLVLSGEHVPLLLDRPVDIITAAIASVRCCVRNPAPMLLWALLIALITWFGLVTFMFGLVVVFPWLAHASWHAYRGMVVSER
jgi:uncharacterized membrane protein